MVNGIRSQYLTVWASSTLNYQNGSMYLAVTARQKLGAFLRHRVFLRQLYTIRRFTYLIALVVGCVTYSPKFIFTQSFGSRGFPEYVGHARLSHRTPPYWFRFPRRPPDGATGVHLTPFTTDNNSAVCCTKAENSSESSV